MNQIIGITMGDPSGIGPEVIAASLAELSPMPGVRFVIYGERSIMAEAARICRAPIEIAEISSPEEAPETGVGVIADGTSISDVRFGEPSEQGRSAAIRWIEAAGRDALAGRIHAIVTGPIRKSMAAGGEAAGHTEILSKLAGIVDPVMMMRGPRLTVVPLTHHIRLADVPAALSSKMIEKKITILADAFKRYFSTPSPRIAMASLNPHAGEQGELGTEEREIMAPALDALRQAGIDVTDPLSADSLFGEAAAGKWDAIVCCYHDQALIPFKMVHFEDGVNATLGLPFIRTSPVHGTAYEIAGTGAARPSSMEAAIRMAVRMAGADKRAGA